VPIVEPEVLMDGDHTLERCEEVTSGVLQVVFDQLFRHRIRLEAMILKPNMVLSGKGCSFQANAQHVAEATIRCFRHHVPAAVPGIAFLSGGQTPEQATENLSTMNDMGPHPWQLSFSYGRALQETALRAWAGRSENVPHAKKLFHHRAKMNGYARGGRYTREMEAAVA
jgi:fructose-bisphosphate aldolase class I